MSVSMSKHYVGGNPKRNKSHTPDIQSSCVLFEGKIDSGILASCGYYNKLLQTGWLKITERYCLMLPEARSPSPAVSRTVVPPDVPGQDPSLPLANQRPRLHSHSGYMSVLDALLTASLRHPN